MKSLVVCGGVDIVIELRIAGRGEGERRLYSYEMLAGVTKLGMKKIVSSKIV